jgi:hypothetical protein
VTFSPWRAKAKRLRSREEFISNDYTGKIYPGLYRQEKPCTLIPFTP